MRILAFESYDTGSHRSVREAISRESAHEWTWITLPGRAWKWRMRTAAFEMLDAAREQGIDDACQFDAVFATSLLNVAELRGVCPAGWRNLPFILYMHENQVAYPPGREAAEVRHRDVHFALTNLASVRSADLTIWNSLWNHRSFIDGMRDILRAAPDRGTRGVLDAFAETSPCVIWPPVEVPASTDAIRSSNGRVQVVWPHRWEHDKGPGELLAIMRAHTSLPIEWAIVGETFRDQPDEFDIIQNDFGSRLIEYGRVERKRYEALLHESDWVLSTAHHEFFGIAVVEALLAGCLPWLPDRLSYPELLPPCAVGLSPINPPGDVDDVRRAIREHLQPAESANAVRRLDAAIESVT